MGEVPALRPRREGSVGVESTTPMHLVPRWAGFVGPVSTLLRSIRSIGPSSGQIRLLPLRTPFLYEMSSRRPAWVVSSPPYGPQADWQLAPIGSHLGRFPPTTPYARSIRKYDRYPYKRSIYMVGGPLGSRAAYTRPNLQRPAGFGPIRAANATPNLLRRKSPSYAPITLVSLLTPLHCIYDPLFVRVRRFVILGRLSAPWRRCDP